jgi:hypothetical protein
MNYMEIVYCKNCGGSSIPFNGTYVNVELRGSKWCEHCQNSKDQSQHHFFCSVKCFNEYMKNNDIEWEE